MSEFQLVMPKMGESIAEATIIRWLKNEGDRIEADEAVLEIATDKVDSEVPSPKGGILGKKLFNDGDVVKVGAAVAIIHLEGAAVVNSVPEVVVNNNSQVAEAVKVAESFVASSNNSDAAANTVIVFIRHWC
jgi:2-oxoglutarate dehydrogenase E2 component (dihydrolipoamide succinyltransferase)